MASTSVNQANNTSGTANPNPISNFSLQGIVNALGRISNAISTLFGAPAGTTVPPGDPQFRQEGFFSVTFAFYSFSFRLGRFDVSFLKAAGIIVLCGLTSFGIMKIVYWAKLAF